MNPTQAIHGTPITPKRFLDQMTGASFCVSYFSPQQLEDVIPLLGPDSVLLLDNGAFSAWKKGLVLDEAYWDGYWSWVKPILDRVPQAVAVVPDVIGGTVEENARLIRELPETLWGYEDRLMVVWHLNEPLSYLRWMLESGFGNIAFGSAGEYASVGTALWDARVDEAFGLIDQLTLDLSHGIARPRIHMMRGLGQLKRGRHPFTTADSTNLARNHWQTKTNENHLITFRARIEKDSFPDAPCAVWPQASWEVPRKMTLAEINRENAECAAALARTMAELIDPVTPPEPPAPVQPFQFALPLPAVYHAPRLAIIEGLPSYAPAHQTGNPRTEGRPTQAGRRQAEALAGEAWLNPGTSRRSLRRKGRQLPLLGSGAPGDTGDSLEALPLYRSIRPDTGQRPPTGRLTEDGTT